MFKLKHLGKIFFLIVLSCFLAGCTGVKLPDFQAMIVNVSRTFPNIWKMVTGLAFFMGILFIFRGVYALKIYGDMRTMMSSQTSLKGAITLLIIGSALLYSPTMYHSLLLTSFNTTTTSPIGYVNPNTILDPATAYALLSFVQLIGLISFIRGWVMLSQQSQSGQSNMGKAMTHIIGGLFAINIQGTIDMFKLTLGL